MSYRELRAPAALAGLVECGWTDTATADATHKVLPDGCMDLVWTGAELLVAGPDTVAHDGTRTRGVTVAGLRFVPGALPSLLAVPAAPLHNRRVALVELVPGPAQDALARLEEGEEPVAVLAALATRLPGAPPDRSVAALRGALAPAALGPPPSGIAGSGPWARAGTAPSGLWARADTTPSGALANAGTTPNGPWTRPGTALAAGRPGARAADRSARALDGDASVAAIADALGCTPRSVHRRCQAAFGYGPAVLRRVLRFRRAAALLRAGLSPAEVAAAAGYADQPHLSRETRTLAGASPGQLASGANRSTPLPSGSSTTA
jgi:AraC-like DNA-binding protein